MHLLLIKKWLTNWVCWTHLFCKEYKQQRNKTFSYIHKYFSNKNVSKMVQDLDLQNKYMTELLKHPRLYMTARKQTNACVSLSTTDSETVFE